jgi:predicted nucleotidyltransferase
MNLIVKTIFGSRLYGTNNEESDLDYKGIYLPTKEE